MRTTTILCLLLTLFCATLGAAGRTVQKGIIREYNEKAAKTPLAGVELNVRSANSTVSAKDGSFTLEFLTLNPGEKVNVRRIEKNGYEIFNKEAVEQWNINPATPFTILMCRSDRFKRIRDAYHKASSQSYARQLKKEQDALARLRAEGKLKEEEYQRSLLELTENYEQQLDKLENYIDRFARIDMTELSAAEQEIIDLVRAGNIDDAIARYDQLDFIGSYCSEMGDIHKLDIAAAAISQASEEKRANADKLRTTVMRQIETLRLAGGRENMARVGRLLQRLADADTTDATAALELASFLQGRDDHSATIEYAGRALRHGDPSQKYLASFLIQSSAILSGNAGFVSGEKLKEMLASEFSHKDPELRICLLSIALINPESFNLSPADIDTFFAEIADFRPASLTQHRSKQLAMVMVSEYKRLHNLYSSPDLLLRDQKAILDYAEEIRKRYGDDKTSGNTSIGVATMYLASLLSRHDFSDFDHISEPYKAICLNLFAGDPEQYKDSYHSFSTICIAREIFRPGAPDAISAYRDYLRTYTSAFPTADASMASLLQNTLSLLSITHAAGVSPIPFIDTFAEVFPLNDASGPLADICTGALLIAATALNADISKFEPLIDESLGRLPDNAPMLVAKGDILLGQGKSAEAKRLLDKAMQAAPNMDISTTRLYRTFHDTGL
ncbi:MAG: hypothetical protein K2M06_03420 [Muribaculaceae bacterium]|nr:hypothetical protein [Muribaculaceae bacterium]